MQLVNVRLTPKMYVRCFNKPMMKMMMIMMLSTLNVTQIQTP